jgi:hypothetical protein
MMVLIKWVKKDTEALVIFGREIGLEANSEKTEYMVMSGEQNAVQNGA